MRSHQKPMLTHKQQLAKLKEKGIQFNFLTIEDSEKLLRETTYYYKISSYKHNFHKDGKGNFINLEFAYLYDLSVIDMRIRYVLLKMCLDYEHSLKVSILNHLTSNAHEDGYSIVQDFMASHRLTIDSLIPSGKHGDSYNNSLYMKNKDEPAIWVVLETMSFGDFAKFVDFYHKRVMDSTKEYELAAKLTGFIKNVRNASAHNHPLIMNIASNRNDRTVTEVHKYLLTIKEISPNTRNKKIRNGKIHDILSLLIAYNRYVTSNAMKNHRYDALQDILIRCCKNESYYEKHNQLTSTYKFFSKVLDNLFKNVYTKGHEK